MTADSTSTGAASTGFGAVRVITLILAAALIGYALSDHPMYGGRPGFGAAQAAIAAFGALLALVTRLPLEWNKRVLLSCISLLFMLAVIELGLALVLAPRYRPPFEHDARYIFKLRPNAYSEHTRFPINGGQRILSHVNADGFRGEELEPRDGRPRVMVYGDSFIHAPYCELEGTFPFQLELALVARLKTKVEVINAGVSSYGPDQVSLRLEDELPKLKPDLVIVAIFAGNDYTDLLRNKLFRLTDDGQLRKNPYRLEQSIREAFEISARESLLKRAIRDASSGLGADSPLAGFAQGGKDPHVAMVDFWLSEAQREYQDFVVKRNDVVTNVYQDYYSADVSLLPNSDSARYQVRMMEAVMQRIQGIAKRAKVPLAFVFIPHPMDVAPNYETGKIDRPRFPDYTPENQTAPLRDIATRNGLPFVNLFDTYKTRDANALYFHGGDDHWNEAGQKLAAQVMADYLVQQQLIGKSR